VRGLSGSARTLIVAFFEDAELAASAMLPEEPRADTADPDRVCTCSASVGQGWAEGTA